MKPHHLGMFLTALLTGCISVPHEDQTQVWTQEGKTEAQARQALGRCQLMAHKHRPQKFEGDAAAWNAVLLNERRIQAQLIYDCMLSEGYTLAPRQPAPKAEQTNPTH